jgi:hypothetical protein
MDPKDVLTKARDGMNLRTVFGEPIRHGDLLIIPWPRSLAAPEADLAKTVGPKG